MSLMILFLYKCIKVVVINILKCVYVQTDLFNLFVSIYYKLVCVNYASLCSAVFRCLCQYTSDETFNRCFSLSLSFFRHLQLGFWRLPYDRDKAHHTHFTIVSLGVLFT